MSNNNKNPMDPERGEQHSGGKVDDGRRLGEPLRRPRSMLRLVWLLLLSSFVMVTAACFCIWLIGYLSSQLLSTQLMGQLRRSLLADIHSQVQNELAAPIRGARNLKLLILQRYPDIMTRGSIENEAGYLSELSALASFMPSVSHWEWGTFNTLGASWHTPEQFSDRYSINSVRTELVSIWQPSQAGGTAERRWYQPTRVHPTARFDPPFTFTPDILPNDTVADIRRFLGPVVNITAVQPGERNVLTAAEDILAAGADSGWVQPHSHHFLNRPPFLSVNALCIVPDPASGRMGLATFTTLAISSINTELQRSPIGEHGRLFLVHNTGHIVATSDPGLASLVQGSEYGLELSSSGDDMLVHIDELLRGWGLVKASGVTKNATIHHTPTEPAQLFEESFNMHGNRHMLQAQLLNKHEVGLPFSVVLLTQDTDFDSAIRERVLYTILLSFGVLLVTLLLVWLLTTALSRPLQDVICFMDRATDAMRTNNPAQQRAHMKQLREEWLLAIGWATPDDEAVIPVDSTPVELSNDIEQARSEVVPSHAAARGDNMRTRCDNRRCGIQVQEVHQLQMAFGTMMQVMTCFDSLDAVNRAKREFIRYVLHEVRVPFSAMMLGIENVSATCDDASLHVDPHSGRALVAANDLRDTIDILQEQGEEVTRILNDVLSMQKIEEGKLVLEPQPCSLERLICSTLYAFRAPCCNAGVYLFVELSDLNMLVATEWPELALTLSQPASREGGGSNSTSLGAQVLLDPYRIKQVVSNFVSNAIKFTPRDGRITVKLDFSDIQRKDAPSETSSWSTMTGSCEPLGSVLATVCVSDTGSGISAEHVHSLFQPYMQVAANQQQGGKGTGLGLSIAKSIVELHGGSVGVDSTLGVGSEFSFSVRLPLLVVSTPRQEALDLRSYGTKSTASSSGLSGNKASVSSRQSRQRHPSATEAVLFDFDNRRWSQRLTPRSQSADMAEQKTDSELLESKDSVITRKSTSSALPDASTASTPSSESGLRVLVAEDSAPNRKMLLSLLRSIRCAPTGVENGKQCVEQLFSAQATTEPFHLVITDGSMPVMDGLEATRHIRSAGLQIPIIAWTGNAFHEDVNAFLDAGANAVYCKPAGRKQLQEAIDKWCPRKESSSVTENSLKSVACERSAS